MKKGLFLTGYLIAFLVNFIGLILNWNHNWFFVIFNAFFAIWMAYYFIKGLKL